MDSEAHGARKFDRPLRETSQIVAAAQDSKRFLEHLQRDQRFISFVRSYKDIASSCTR